MIIINKTIELEHRVCEFNCMLSGLEDMIEEKWHVRLPEHLLFISAYIGFKYDKVCGEKIPRNVMPGYGVGRIHYNFFADILNFEWHIAEDLPFEEAWINIKALLDEGTPVIVGELDMFHLSYLKKFYHRIHVPFHYITIVGYDDKKACVLIQDCAREGVQEIFKDDLQKAMSKDVLGLCKKNTYFWFDFKNDEKPLSECTIIKKILKKCGNLFLEHGIEEMQRFIDDFPSWHDNLSEKQFTNCLRYLVTFTCSYAPMLPQKLVIFRLDEIFLKHHAMRDRFAILLKEIGIKFDIQECVLASAYFEGSGYLFHELTDLITDYLAKIMKKKKSKQELSQVPCIMRKIADLETQGFNILSQILLEGERV